MGTRIAAAFAWVLLAACSSKEDASVPETLVSSDGNFLRIAVDAGGFYWTVGGVAGRGKVLSLGPSGGEPVELAKELEGPLAIALDESNVYFSDLGAAGASVSRLSRAGGTPSVLVSGQKRPTGLHVLTQNVYWTDADAGAVLRMPVEGGDAETLAQQQLGPEGIAASAQNVAWANAAGGSIERVDITVGTTQSQVAAAQNGVHDVAIDPLSGAIYWTTTGSAPGADGTIGRAGADGGGAATIASERNIGAGGAISVDLDGVYWIEVEGTDYSVMKMPHSGGSPAALGTGTAAAVYDLAAWGDAVYVLVSDGQRGSVVKIAK